MRPSWRLLGLATVGMACALGWGLRQWQEEQEQLDGPERRLTGPTANVPTVSAHAQALAVLHSRCVACHGPVKQKGGLRLDTARAAFAGGESGAVVEPGWPERSMLMSALSHQDADLKMPPSGKLPDDEIAALASWIKDTGAWAGLQGHAAPRRAGHSTRAVEHWAFRPLRPVAPPPEAEELAPVDRFLRAAAARKGLATAAEADRHTLLRRLSFDLVGLPPTPEEIEAFIRDDSPQAYEKVVDRLLASPHFGERWGRHWLDVVRYADSRGQELDVPSANAYEYRDYVIRALNADVPFRQFVLEHIAGDLLPTPRVHAAHGWNESILGTGFWYLGEWLHSPVDTRKDEAERIENQIDVFGKAFLGLTVACARCHDHKFDPITQEDYYALAGFLKSSSYRQVRYQTVERERRLAREMQAVRSESRRTLMPPTVDLLRSMVQNWDRYLLAARTVLAAGPQERTPRSTLTDQQLAQVRAQARQHDLSAWTLQQLVLELLGNHDRSHPLYPWMQLAALPEDQSPGAFRSRLAAFTQRGQEDAKALENTIPVIRRPQDWISDDFTMGGVARVGDVHFAPAPGPLGFQVFSRPAVYREPSWPKVRSAAGAAAEAGALRNRPGAGRTVRTRSFTLEKKGLAYRVSGPGHAFVAVDSLRLIEGPLHKGLYQTWPAGGTPQWVWHDLAAYRGHLVHLELSPGDTDAFQVLDVIQADGVPTAAPAFQGTLRALLREPAPHTPEALAAAYQKWFAAALDRLLDDPTDVDDRSADDAEAAHWLGQRLSWAAPAAVAELAEKSRPLAQRLAALGAQAPLESREAPAMLDGDPQDAPLLVRGEANAPAKTVPRRFLQAFDPTPLATPQGSGRLLLAERLLDRSSPLAARVFVNRVWQQLFGTGLVSTPDNLGALGESCAHPELLDYLALEFSNDGLSVKRLIRRLVLSRAYRLASEAEAATREADPTNESLSRRQVRRLDAEAVRDAILAVSGRLERTQFGPSIPPPADAFHVNATQFKDEVNGPIDGAGRRSIYLAVRRLRPSTFLQVFDFPQPTTTVGRRDVSNVPGQALALLNDAFVEGQVRHWGQHLAGLRQPPRQTVALMYLRALGRPPRDAEQEAAVRFVVGQAQYHGLPADGWTADPRPWTDLGHVLLNTKEFLYLR